MCGDKKGKFYEIPRWKNALTAENWASLIEFELIAILQRRATIRWRTSKSTASGKNWDQMTLLIDFLLLDHFNVFNQRRGKNMDNGMLLLESSFTPFWKMGSFLCKPVLNQTWNPLFKAQQKNPVCKPGWKSSFKKDWKSGFKTIGKSDIKKREEIQFQNGKKSKIRQLTGEVSSSWRRPRKSSSTF